MSNIAERIMIKANLIENEHVKRHKDEDINTYLLRIKKYINAQSRCREPIIDKYIL
jgi:hypothetical protein